MVGTRSVRFVTDNVHINKPDNIVTKSLVQASKYIIHESKKQKRLSVELKLSNAQYNVLTGKSVPLNTRYHKWLTKINTILIKKHLILICLIEEQSLIMCVSKIIPPLSKVANSYSNNPKVIEEPLESTLPPLKTTRLYDNIRDSIIVRDDQDEIRIMLKNKVIDDISKSANVEPEKVKIILHNWACSSFFKQSINLQQAVAKRFGIEGDDYYNSKIFQDYDTPSTSTMLIADSIYENTQKLLSNKGNKIFLYRGISLNEALESIVGYDQIRQLNPLSSFSENFFTALNFASNNRQCMFVLGAWFPVSRIFSTPFTGIGCNREAEYVVLGGKYTVHNDPVVLYRLTLGGDLRQFISMPTRLTTKKDYNFVQSQIAKIAEFNDESVEDVISNVSYLSTSAQQIVNIDANLTNADWCKQSWDLPEYGSKEFLAFCKASNITVEQFKLLPVYKHAIKNGAIK